VGDRLRVGGGVGDRLHVGGGVGDRLHVGGGVGDRLRIGAGAVSEQSPDLHAIFGMEESASAGVDSVVGLAPAQAEPVVDLAPPELPAVEPAVPRAAEPEPPEPSRPHTAGEETGEEGGRTGLTKPSRRGSSSRFLTDVIVDMGLVPRARVEEAIESSRSTGTTPERVLVGDGALSTDGLARALAERYGLDHLDLSVFSVDMGAANLVTTAAAKRYQAVPVAFIDKRTLLVAMTDPSNVLAVDDIAIMTGYEVRVGVAAPEDIESLISRLDRLEDVVSGTEAARAAEAEEASAEVVDLRETADDAPVIKLVNQIVAQAVELHASDIHLAPDGKEVRVRFRVDGVLQDITTVPRRMAAGVVSRVKIMAELDISEKRIPQDGRVGLTVDSRHVDLRVVTLPSVHGESIVMRILDKDSVVMKLEKLGMADSERERFERAFAQAHGAVLVTGPTGSGKSTTLYAALLALNTPEKNIITVEDPVEYQVEGITQVQVSPKAGLTFATGLRAMVRADPDVIMVGEIRDRETAQIAIESALTGHLVLSTLHTNDAPSAITRLVEMGIEPFLVASALDCVLAQRLVRMLCSNCKRRTIISADVLRENGYKALVDLEAYEPVGCRRCGGSGYRGRGGIYEVMTVTSEVRSLALERRSADDLREVAVRQGMRRLRDDGLDKVRQGRTSMAEIARVIGSN
jgi:type IV pilus assembly protein PilB